MQIEAKERVEFIADVGIMIDSVVPEYRPYSPRGFSINKFFEESLEWVHDATAADMLCEIALVNASGNLELHVLVEGTSVLKQEI